ncbi:UNVERIFIED_CONTAM: hypothetical protein HDU68_005569 [Siphonaria sp. JEL0065]|nr:hypothetical protein HDU68_005569 [Siphonaria sp. JEL0065]
MLLQRMLVAKHTFNSLVQKQATLSKVNSNFRFNSKFFSNSSVAANLNDVKTTTKKTLLGSLLRGDADDDASLNETHFEDSQSKVASRGKYVHEMMIHNVKPDAWDEYVALIADYYPKISADPNYKMKLFGSWHTEIGKLDQVVHIWQYDNYPGYDGSRSLRTNDPLRNDFMKKLRPLITSRENQIMLEFDFWYTSDPAKLGGIYELRTYNLKPGRLLEWKNEWQKGLLARKKFVKPVGAWFSQIGDLHVVHHMWAYPNLYVRKEMREKAWEIDGWNKTSYNTVRMLNNMHCRIMRPFEFSPMG